MKIKLNKIEFDVTAVPANVRDVLLADPVLMQGVSRPVWRWDQPTKAGTVMVQMTRERGVPLPNGISFFVARAGADGEVQKAEAPTAKMASRFLEAVGAKSLLEVMQALNKIANIPQKTLPLQNFAPLNPVASYQITVNIDYAVVQLVNAARNLSAYFFVPGQVDFTHQITTIHDQAAYDALIAAQPRLRNMQPAFVIPPGTQANTMLRRLAMAKRMNELQISMAGQRPEDLAADDPRRITIARLGVEWRVLAPPKQTAA